MTDTTTDKGLVERQDTDAKCRNCDDGGWVCENHFDHPWDGTSSRQDACGCGAGAPCPVCNLDMAASPLTEPLRRTIERLERERDALAKVVDADEPNPGLMARIILRSQENELRAEAAESRLSRITAPVEGMAAQSAWAGDDAPIVHVVARAIAANGFGRSWDDFEPINASDTDQGDLTEYARAAVAAMPDLETLSSRLRVAEEALEPFAKAAETIDADIRDEGLVIDFYTPDCQVVPKASIRYGDLRRAASIRARGES